MHHSASGGAGGGVQQFGVTLDISDRERVHAGAYEASGPRVTAVRQFIYIYIQYGCIAGGGGGAMRTMISGIWYAGC